MRRLLAKSNPATTDHFARADYVDPTPILNCMRAAEALPYAPAAARSEESILARNAVLTLLDSQAINRRPRKTANNCMRM